jgi:hypothetical protein
MKNLTILMLLLSVFTSISHAAIINVTVEGEFGDESNMFPGYGNNDPYPFEELYGGSFSGTFQFDNELLDSSNSYFNIFAMTAVSVDIKDNADNIINTISNQSPQNNILRAAVNGSSIQMIFGYSFGIPNALEDLRISFSGNFLTGANIGPSVSVINSSTIRTTNDTDSFIETDTDNSNYWGLKVVGGTISAASPETANPVPTPSSFWLSAFGILLIARRKLSTFTGPAK